MCLLLRFQLLLIEVCSADETDAFARTTIKTRVTDFKAIIKARLSASFFTHSYGLTFPSRIAPSHFKLDRSDNKAMPREK